MSKGRHLILDLYDCDPGILDDYDELMRLLEVPLNMAGATVLRIFRGKI
jgi:S-adenosylmethionine/arginine decarboxylase-like enzyme